MKKIGVIGASFNPPTRGHQSVISQAAQHFDAILLVPSLKHPFDKTHAPYFHRSAMINLFIKTLPGGAQDKTQLFNVEGMILAEHAKQYVYTYDVLEKLEQYYKIRNESVALRFVMGPDLAKPDTWKKFYQYQAIEKRWPPFVVQEQILVHSQDIRALVAGFKQTKDLKLIEQKINKLTQLTPEPVARYIVRHGLYE